MSGSNIKDNKVVLKEDVLVFVSSAGDLDTLTAGEIEIYIHYVTLE